ncbi:penicillin acylase family protein [Ferrovibrio sp.]|uniref:penicillin acylase family protein n=1 Tax=Ferrovibrio sp. TaxID=1917215 RepID=UPI000CB0E97F|nr:penicillin acylase family protein [Ferrovibrio sp.]PJI44285.1 MAG: acyl-homoserine-lactone acylase [Ferrovibrio sp.]
MRWIVRLIVLLFVLLGLAAGGSYVVAHLSLPVFNGEVKVGQTLSGPVEILRDRNAVAHIRAASRNDAAFGLGYAHVQDRLWQMEVQRRVAAGRLSELFGTATLNTDKFIRTLGIRRKAVTAFAHLKPETQTTLQAYADGVNAFLASRNGPLPPEFLIFDVTPEPWTPADSLGWLKMMAWDLGGNWGRELATLGLSKRLTKQQIEEFYPPYPGDGPVALAEMSELYRKVATAVDVERLLEILPPERPEGVGSNNWVINGKHTVTGQPLLANDPHLGLATPALWYFAHMASPAGSAIGATLPGVPGVVLGHNGRVAWGFTNTGPDTQDLYIEKIDPADPTQYVTPNGSAAFVTRQETIKQRSGEDVVITVRETRHGPVISDVHDGARQQLEAGYVLSFAWTALLDEDTTADALLGLDSITDWNGFNDNLKRFVTPQQNIVYADREGNIGFVAPGLIPIRRADNDLKGLAPAPGWDARYDWNGFIPFEQLPRSYNPPRGIIVTANNKIVPDNYPYFITADWAEPYRARRIEQLLKERNVHSVESFKQLQGDTMSPMVSEILPLLLAVPPKNLPRNSELAGSHALLASWDGNMSINRAEPLIFQAWYRELTRLILADELGDAFQPLWRFRPILIRNILTNQNGQSRWCANQATGATTSCAELVAEALDRALDDLKTRYGSDMARWRWGEAHAARGTHRPFSNIAVLRRFFEVSVPTGGDAFTVNVGRNDIANDKDPFANRHAASLRAIYDLADLNRSQFMHSTGQSGHVLSPHYRDYAIPWAAVEYIPMSMRPADFETGALGRLRLTAR